MMITDKNGFIHNHDNSVFCHENEVVSIKSEHDYHDYTLVDTHGKKGDTVVIRVPHLSDVLNQILWHINKAIDNYIEKVKEEYPADKETLINFIKRIEIERTASLNGAIVYYYAMEE